MHKEVRQWIRKVRRINPSFFFGKKVLECGSLNINGSPREYFYFSCYKGIDIGQGKGVDYVIGAHVLGIKCFFDVIVSTEMLEHDENWQESLRRMYNALKPGGLMIITCASIQREEDGTTRTTPQYSPYTTDYYRNLSIIDFLGVFGIIPDFEKIEGQYISKGTMFKHGEICYKRGMKDLMFWAIKN